MWTPARRVKVRSGAWNGCDPSREKVGPEGPTKRRRGINLVEPVAARRAQRLDSSGGALEKGQGPGAVLDLQRPDGSGAGPPLPG